MAIPARWALEQFGDQGIIVVLGLTGMWDVDAAVLTLAGMPKDILDGTTAGLVLAVPVLANTALKGVLALGIRSEEHTSELQSLMRISYAVFCLKKKNKNSNHMSTM